MKNKQWIWIFYPKGILFCLILFFTINAKEKFLFTLECPGILLTYLPFYFDHSLKDSLEICYGNTEVANSIKIPKSLPVSSEDLFKITSFQRDIQRSLDSIVNVNLKKNNRTMDTLFFSLEFPNFGEEKKKFEILVSPISDTLEMFKFEKDSLTIQTNSSPGEIIDSLKIKRRILDEISKKLQKAMPSDEHFSSKGNTRCDEQKELGRISLQDPNNYIPVWTNESKNNPSIWLTDYLMKGCKILGQAVLFGLNPINYTVSHLIIDQRKKFNSDSKNLPIGFFKASNVDIAFSDGTIKDIIAEGDFYKDKNTNSPKISMSFHNTAQIPIGTSSQIDRVNNIENNWLLGNKIESKNTLFDSSGKAIYAFVDLAELIQYHRTVMKTGNFIPESKEIRLNTNKDSSTIPLKKKSFIDDFDIRLYSDITGLKRESPNGLVQTDARYSLALNLSELRLSPTWNTIAGFFPFWIATLPAISSNWPNKFNNRLTFSTKQETITYWACLMTEITFLSQSIFFPAITPFITFSKLEDKGGVPAAAFQDSASHFYAITPFSMFDLYIYSNLKLGTDFTFAKTTFSESNIIVKSQIEAGFFQTPIDSVYDGSTNKLIMHSTNLLSWYIHPEVLISPIHSDRIDFDVRYGMIFPDILSSNIQNNFRKIEKTDNEQFFHKFQMNFNIYTNPQEKNSWVFLRASMLSQGSNSNFSMQIGYATAISKLLGANQAASNNN
jgi:hypothetical protein